ncbi:MAG TPA: pyridoxamine 5'-phosphate oxidase family protein [Longimicrobium sp.]|nr:pyridoxamine 5'-phosphate oxidase family protein [Longimicrobium sp.]
MGPFHEGELEVQARAGVAAAARRVGGIVRGEVPEQWAGFLEAQRMGVLATVGGDGAAWPSLLAGEAPPVRLVAPAALEITTPPHPSDPFWEMAGTDSRVSFAAPAGLLVIDPETRRRVRINGVIERGEDRTLTLHVREAYGNCPKYIQTRHLESGAPERAARLAARRSTGLTEAQRAWIRHADTLFIATAHPRAGADASHRGGLPGFILLTGENEIAIPDYSGNNMFNTLGNIVANPAAGLLLVDFERGRTLQLTGHASVTWDAPWLAKAPGAARGIEFRVRAAVEIADGNPLRWRFGEYSPFNPPVPVG